MKALFLAWLGTASLGSELVDDPFYKGRPVSEWVKKLSDPDRHVRYWTLHALSEIGFAGRQAVPVLIERLADDDPHVRARAARVLGRIGPLPARPAMPALLKLLRDGDPVVRHCAAGALGLMGKAAVPELAKLLGEDEDAETRRAAIRALTAAGPDAKAALPELIKLFESREMKDLMLVANAVGVMGPEIVPDLIHALKTGKTATRWMAAARVGGFGADAAPAVPALIECLRDSEHGVRYFAANSLGLIGPKAEAAIPELIRYLGRHEESPLYSNTAAALAGIGPAAIPALTRALDDEAPHVRAGAAEALGQIGTKAKEAAPKIRKLLADRNPEVRRRAAEAISHVGVEPEQLLADLKPLLDDKDEYVRSQARRGLATLGPIAKSAAPAFLKQTAYHAVARIDPKSLLEVLRHGVETTDPFFYESFGETLGTVREVILPDVIELLRHPGAAVRARAAQTLRGMGPSAVRLAAPELKKLLEDQDDSARWAAAETLIKTRTELKAAVPVMEGFLNDLKRPDRAVYILSGLGPEGKAAVPALVAMLREKKKGSYAPSTIDSLASIGPGAAEAVPVLTEHLRDEGWLVRGAAANALGEVGPKARPAVPELARLLTDEEEYVRLRAARALGLIGGPEAVRAVPKLVALFDDRREDVREAAAESVKRLAPDVARKAGIR